MSDWHSQGGCNRALGVCRQSGVSKYTELGLLGEGIPEEGENSLQRSLGVSLKGGQEGAKALGPAALSAPPSHTPTHPRTPHPSASGRDVGKMDIWSLYLTH